MKGINYIITGIYPKLSLLLIILLNGYTGRSQDRDLIADTLENGFTYFIKPVENSGGTIYMDLIIRAGYNNQMNGQYELAHFVEHQPVKEFLNGLYTNKSIFNKALESDSLYFNGRTANDRTIFYFHYPSSNPEFTEKGLDFFSELLSGNKKLNPIFFEAEKGAFYQEIALSKIGMNPFHKQLINAVYSDCYKKPVVPDSLWTHIQNYSLNETEEFLNKWYQPELSSLIILGEIEDVKDLQIKIQEYFSSSKKSLPIKQERCDETLTTKPPKFQVIKNKDIEVDGNVEVSFHLYKNELPLMNGLSKIQWDFLKPILIQAININLWNDFEYYNSPTIPTISWSEEFPVLDVSIKSSMGQEEMAIKEVMKSLNMLRFTGITQDDWANFYRQGFEGLDHPNPTLKYWQNHLKKIALGQDNLTAKEREKLKQWWEKFTFEDFNFYLTEILKQDFQDFVIIAPIFSDYDELFWRNKTLDWLSKSQVKFKSQGLEDLEYTELPKDIFDARIFEFPSGQEVIFKEISKNEKEKDFIYLQAFKSFKASKLDKNQYYQAMIIPEIIQNSGFGDYDKFDLKRIQSSNSLKKLDTYITEVQSGVIGEYQGRDFELFFNLIEDVFNNVRRDSIAFSDWQKRSWKRFLNPGHSREISDFTGSVNKSLKLPRRNLSISESFKASRDIEMDNAYRLYDYLFKNAKDFTFVITSSKNAEDILPLIAPIFQIKSTPSEILQVAEKNDREQNNNPEVIQVSSIPNANALLEIKYIHNSDWKNRLIYQIIAEIIKDRIPKLRFIHNRPIYRYTVKTFNSFETNQGGISIILSTLEKDVKNLSQDIQNIISNLQENEINDIEFEKAINGKLILKQSRDWSQQPSSIFEILLDYYRYNIVPPQKHEMEKFLQTLSPTDLKIAARDFLIEVNKREIIGVPDLD